MRTSVFQKKILSIIHSSNLFHSQIEKCGFDVHDTLNDINEKIISFAHLPSSDFSKAGIALLTSFFNDNSIKYEGLTYSYIHDLLNLIKEVRINHNYRYDCQDALIELTKNLDPLSLWCNKWFSLQYLCIKNGLFKLAYYVRLKAIESARLQAEKGNYCPSIMAIKSCIELREFNEISSYFPEINKKNSLHKSFEDLVLYSHLMKGNIYEFQRIKQKKFDLMDNKFLDMISNKSVAIVGPAVPDEVMGSEIDSFDIIVRLNFRGEHLKYSEKIGERTDLSYINMVFAKKIDGGIESLESKTYKVFKSFEYKFQKTIMDNKNGRIVKRNNNFLHGTPLLANVALFDLLHFRPAEIKLFNVNFFLTKHHYYSGFLFNLSTQNDLYQNFDFLSGFAHHDIISNFNFTQNLFNSKLISIDNMCKSVISLSPLNYLSSMENLLHLNDF